ncbi:mycofactocin-coupled SDR family oxidoreductase [Pseudonocardia sp. NPDC049154]|uniref:mycofactocin-coupled SDR family oxidoreductase n=1 Tax=Pseudonocardia sp. NPDC049154 TaxID=3155501 RepID=UPI0033D838A6
MAGRFEGKTVVISGAARGQGRSHAVRFAEEGANVVGFDVCAQVGEPGYPVSTPEDLAETGELVRAAGAKGFTEIADVRDAAAVEAVFQRAVAEFGGVDVAVANAGIVQRGARAWEIEEDVFRTVLDVNVVGAWHVLKSGITAMRAGGPRGSVVVIGSGASVKGLANVGAYVTSKHALVGLVRTAAKEAASEGIRVNLVTPGNVGTPMFLNDAIKAIYVPDIEDPTDQQLAERAATGVPMQIPYVEAVDISEAVLFLASDAARYVTGSILPVDGGSAIP